MAVSRANETEEQSVARMEANKVRIKRKRENETTDECDARNEESHRLSFKTWVGS